MHRGLPFSPAGRPGCCASGKGARCGQCWGRYCPWALCSLGSPAVFRLQVCRNWTESMRAAETRKSGTPWLAFWIHLGVFSGEAVIRKAWGLKNPAVCWYTVTGRHFSCFWRHSSVLKEHWKDRLQGPDCQEQAGAGLALYKPPWSQLSNNGRQCSG